MAKSKICCENTCKEFKVVPPKKSSENKYPVDDLLIPLNFRVLISGSSASGKGVCLANILSNKFPYKDIFKNNIFLFSTTYSLGDPSLAELDIPEENCFDKMDEEILSQILQEQKLNILEYSKNNVPPLLMIFDDILTSVNNKKNAVINEIFYSGRHYMISSIILVQQYKAIQRPIRTNCTCLILFAAENNKELNTLMDEMPCKSKLFEKIFKEATNDQPFSFLKVNLKQTDKNKRFQLRFSNRFFDMNEEVPIKKLIKN